MFGNVIYYDRKKINEYTALIRGQSNLQIDELEVVNDKGAQFDFKVVGADVNSNKTYKAKVLESLLNNCNEFEKMLSDRDDYLDFTERPEYDLQYVGRGTIVKFDGYIRVPEEFDLTQTIDKFKPLFVSSISTNDSDEAEQEAIRLFLETKDTKMPVTIEFGDYILCAKLNTNDLLISYEDMEEYEELEVTTIARITTNNVINKEKPYYDPLKDFIKLNRYMRRTMKERGEGINEIFAEDDYKTIEVLAVYQ